MYEFYLYQLMVYFSETNNIWHIISSVLNQHYRVNIIPDISKFDTVFATYSYQPIFKTLPSVKKSVKQCLSSTIVLASFQQDCFEYNEYMYIICLVSVFNLTFPFNDVYTPDASSKFICLCRWYYASKETYCWAEKATGSARTFPTPGKVTVITLILLYLNLNSLSSIAY